MFEDKVIRGAILGILANAISKIFEYPLWKLKVIKHPLAHYASSIFVNPNHDIFNGSLTGFLTDYIYSAFLGIVFLYFLELTGKRYHRIKGLLYGAFLWITSYAGVRSLFLVKLRETPPQDVIVQFFLHLIYGVILGWLAYGVERWKNEKRFS